MKEYNNKVKNVYKQYKKNKGEFIMSTFYELLLESIEFYSQFGWTKQKTYNYLKNSFLRYKNIKYIQNRKHGATAHFK